MLHEIDAAAHGSFGEIVQVILYLPPGTTIQDEAGWRAESQLARYFARDPRIQHVWAVTTLNPVLLGGPEILKQLPESERRSFVSADGRAVLLALLPHKDLAAPDAVRLVREIRAANLETITGIAGAHLDVGGLPGFNADYEDAIKSALGPVIVSVICATLLVLSLAFRSVLIPVEGGGVESVVGGRRLRRRRHRVPARSRGEARGPPKSDARRLSDFARAWCSASCSA